MSSRAHQKRTAPVLGLYFESLSLKTELIGGPEHKRHHEEINGETHKKTHEKKTKNDANIICKNDLESVKETITEAGLVREASSTAPPHSLPFHWKGDVEFEKGTDEEVELDDGSKRTIRMPTWLGVEPLGKTGWKLKWTFEGPYRDELDTYTNYADALCGVHTEEDAERLEEDALDWMHMGFNNEVSSINFELDPPTALPSNITVKITHETGTIDVSELSWTYTLPDPVTAMYCTVPLTIDVTEKQDTRHPWPRPNEMRVWSKPEDAKHGTRLLGLVKYTDVNSLQPGTLIQVFTDDVEFIYCTIQKVNNSIVYVEGEESVQGKKNNETTGISGEMAVCVVYGIPFQKNEEQDPVNHVSRAHYNIVQKCIPAIERFKNDHPDIHIVKHIGGKNGSTDFLLKNGRTLSWKTTEKNEGSMCPQTIGQMTLKSWDRFFLKDKTEIQYRWEAGDKSKIRERIVWIRDHIGSYIQKQYDNLFCCDYLVHLKDCMKSPEAVIYTKSTKFHFEKRQYEWSSSIPDDLGVLVELSNGHTKYNGFSSTLYLQIKDQDMSSSTKIKVATLQTNSMTFANGTLISGRESVKFRFASEFIQLL